MIGDVPKGAPLRCKLGRHTDQETGGTMAFTCGRCGGTYWQEYKHRIRLMLVEAVADQRVQAGDHSAVVWAHSEVARIVSEK